MSKRAGALLPSNLPDALNNVYTDRINIRTFQPRSGNPRAWTALTLRGNETVFEQTIEPPKDDGSEFMRRMRADSPDFYRARHYTYSEYELHLTTNDQDELKERGNTSSATDAPGSKSDVRTSRCFSKSQQSRGCTTRCSGFQQA
jgi:hypothetical protein